MFPTLILTSPETTGAAVKRLQRALRKTGYLDGPADGTFGPLTAQACFRAKWWLGYPEEKIDHVGGAQLLALLEGTAEPTQRQEKLRAQRLKQKELETAPMRERALDYGLTEYAGIPEDPAFSNNNVLTRKWMGSDGKAWTARNPGPPYCSMMVSSCYIAVGSVAFAYRGWRYPYVPALEAAARDGRDGLAIIRNATVAKPGDVITFRWSGSVGQHVGMKVRNMKPNERDEFGIGGDFLCFEANTSPGNDANGGLIVVRARRLDEVNEAIHVGR